MSIKSISKTVLKKMLISFMKLILTKSTLASKLLKSISNRFPNIKNRLRNLAVNRGLINEQTDIQPAIAEPTDIIANMSNLPPRAAKSYNDITTEIQSAIAETSDIQPAIAEPTDIIANISNLPMHAAKIYYDIKKEIEVRKCRCE